MVVRCEKEARAGCPPEGTGGGSATEMGWLMLEGETSILTGRPFWY